MKTIPENFILLIVKGLWDAIFENPYDQIEFIPKERNNNMATQIKTTKQVNYTEIFERIATARKNNELAKLRKEYSIAKSATEIFPNEQSFKDKLGAVTWDMKISGHKTNLLYAISKLKIDASNQEEAYDQILSTLDALKGIVESLKKGVAEKDLY